MIKIFCDICGQEKEETHLTFFGISSASKAGLILVSENDDFPKITECKKHICYLCLRKLGWEPEPEDTKA